MEKLPHYRDIPKLFNICLILFLFHTIFLSLIWRQHNTDWLNINTRHSCLFGNAGSLPSCTFLRYSDSHTFAKGCQWNSGYLFNE